MTHGCTAGRTETERDEVDQALADFDVADDAGTEAEFAALGFDGEYAQLGCAW